MSKVKYEIHLTFYGPFTDYRDLRRDLNAAQKPPYDEKRALYMAAKRSPYKGYDEITYVGITQAQVMSSRFNKRHTIRKNEKECNRLWAGYFYSDVEDEKFGRHERRLTVAEDILITWFRPKLNKKGLTVLDGERVGDGSYCDGMVHLHWDNPNLKPMVDPKYPLPKIVEYSVNRSNDPKKDYIWPWY